MIWRQVFNRAGVMLLILALALAGCQGASNGGIPSWLGGLIQTVEAPTPTPAPPQATPVGTPTSPAALPLASDATPTQVKNPLPPVQAAELKGTTITVLYPWSGQAGQGFQSLVDQFNRANTWGITVTAVMAGSQSEVAGWMKGALGTPQPTSTTPGLSEPPPALPDVVVADPVAASGWQATGSPLVDLGPYIGDPTWGLTGAEKKDLATGQWPGAGGSQSASGPVLAAPAQRSMVLLFYNQGWAQSLGFTRPPVTPGDFRQQACKAAQANQYDPDPQRRGTGGWLITADALPVLAWIEVYGGQIGPNAQGLYTFNTPQVTQAFTFLKNLENQNCAWVGREALPYPYFASRDALFYVGTLDDIPAQSNAMKTASHPDAWTVIPFPSADGKPFVLTDDLAYYLVKTNRLRQMAGWLFIRWLESSQAQVQWVKMVGTAPLGVSVNAVLAGFRAQNPQLSAAFDLRSLARPQPAQASWTIASGVLSDGASQVLQPEATLDVIPAVLAQMDQTAAELIARQAR